MDKEFINKTITKAINDYLSSKSNPEGVLYNSFNVVMIRLLVTIYDELDILNPFYALNEEDFDNNLKKYGYHIDGIIKLKHAFEDYDNEETSDGFVFIQKIIIDMFMAKIKKIDVSVEEIDTFRNTLYSSYSSNTLMLSYNFLMCNDPNEVINYFDDALEKYSSTKYEKPKQTLNLEAYKLLKYSLEDIKDMNANELDDINNEVYKYFKIDPDAINKDYLLEQAVIKERKRQKKAASTSGHINLIFISIMIGILCVGLAVITIFIL